MIRNGNVWLENEKDYEFHFKRGIQESSSKYKLNYFWEREKIKSCVAIRLEYNGIPLGVLFFNYRIPQNFNEKTKRLILAFSRLASSAIANANSLQAKDDFWRSQAQMSKSMTESEIAASIAHNSGNSLSILNLHFNQLVTSTSPNKFQNEKILKEIISNYINGVEPPLIQLKLGFDMLSDYRKSAILEKKDYSIEDIIRESLQLVKELLKKEGITIEKVFKCNPDIHCDKNQLKHVILNLIFNAKDSILESKKKDGLIRITCDWENSENKFVVINIADNGIGIDENSHSKIFVMYYSTKDKGTGLGLPISKHIIEQHEGRIDFQSDLNKWTQFKIILPIKY